MEPWTSHWNDDNNGFVLCYYIYLNCYCCRNSILDNTYNMRGEHFWNNSIILLCILCIELFAMGESLKYCCMFFQRTYLDIHISIDIYIYTWSKRRQCSPTMRYSLSISNSNWMVWRRFRLWLCIKMSNHLKITKGNKKANNGNQIVNDYAEEDGERERDSIVNWSRNP